MNLNQYTEKAQEAIKKLGSKRAPPHRQRVQEWPIDVPQLADSVPVDTYHPGTVGR